MKTDDRIANAITDCFISPNVSDSNMEPANVVDVLNKLAVYLKYLGGGDNTDSRGAIEVHAIAISEGAEAIAGALRDVAEAIRETARVRA